MPDIQLKVTFDTNTLASVVSPETAQRDTGESGGAIRHAIQNERIAGFFSETIVTLEGIQNKERAEILGKTRVVPEASSTGDNTIALAISARHVRNPLDANCFARVQAATELGMQALMAPARMVALHVRDDVCPLFEPPGGISDLLRCMDEVNEMATRIATRGVGHAVAVEVGLLFSQRAGVTKPELWLQGLGRARGKAESKKVAKAIREWADGDSIASHYGFGNDVFCTDDFAKSATASSVLDKDNRKWLAEDFGIRFMTLAELARTFGDIT
jgi:hypothetical protein